MNNLSNEEIFAENLQYYMELNNKSRYDICRDLGFPYTTLAQWYKGKSYPRIEHIEKLANYFHIRKSDLIEDKNHAIDINTNIIEIPILENIKTKHDYLFRPNWLATIKIDKTLFKAKTLFALKVKGDSMTPVLLENDIIIISKQNDFSTGDIVVAINENGELIIRKAIKSASHVIFQAFNPSYEPMVFNYSALKCIRIIGIIKQLQRNFERRNPAMYLIYADESGNTGTDYDNKEQPIFVIAGVLIDDANW
ncbi:MAG: helix-turn-helix domain-containing protein, partial [Clostridia bacterium]|nr:helix-turn-helix domain-containing protein [Clostridia bacterium]